MPVILAGSPDAVAERYAFKTLLDEALKRVP
jgi:hypothetical protein